LVNRAVLKRPPAQTRWLAFITFKSLIFHLKHKANYPKGKEKHTQMREEKRENKGKEDAFYITSVFLVANKVKPQFFPREEEIQT
jgi:hypothetical protein